METMALIRPLAELLKEDEEYLAPKEVDFEDNKPVDAQN